MKAMTRFFGGAALLAVFGALPAAAQVIGKARNGQLGLQEAATPIMEQVASFHDQLLIIMSLVTLVVAGLLLWVILRFNRRVNPEPSKTSHNTVLEVLWTTVPIIILVLIAFPSFRLLYAQDVIPDADLVIKATGHQWYWSYEYPDADNMAFDAFMLPTRLFDEDTAAARADRSQAQRDLAAFLGRSEPPEVYRLLDTTSRIVVPVGKVVKVLVTASDVLHSWAIPSFGVKIDAVPGRLNETWFQATKIGTFYGQCSEICGTGHSFMPIVVEVMSEADYARWLDRTRADYADAGATTRFAALAAN